MCDHTFEQTEKMKLVWKHMCYIIEYYWKHSTPLHCKREQVSSNKKGKELGEEDWEWEEEVKEKKVEEKNTYG